MLLGLFSGVDGNFYKLVSNFFGGCWISSKDEVVLDIFVWDLSFMMYIVIYFFWGVDFGILVGKYVIDVMFFLIWWISFSVVYWFEIEYKV